MKTQTNLIKKILDGGPRNIRKGTPGAGLKEFLIQNIAYISGVAILAIGAANIPNFNNYIIGEIDKDLDNGTISISRGDNPAEIHNIYFALNPAKLMEARDECGIDKPTFDALEADLNGGNYSSGKVLFPCESEFRYSPGVDRYKKDNVVTDLGKTF